MARDRMQDADLDLIKLLQKIRLFKAAFAELLPHSKLEKLKKQTEIFGLMVNDRDE